MKACRPRRFDGLLKTGSILSSQRCHCNVRVLQKEYGKAARVSGSFSGSRPGLCHAVAQKASPAKTNHDLKTIKAIFREAKRDGYIGEHASEFVDPVRKSPQNSRRPFTVSEIQMVLAVADAEWRSMILFGLYTGQRLADIASRRWILVEEFGRVTSISYETVTSTALRAPPYTAKLLIYKILRQHLWR
jgi:integrase